MAPAAPLLPTLEGKMPIRGRSRIDKAQRWVEAHEMLADAIALGSVASLFALSSAAVGAVCGADSGWFFLRFFGGACFLVLVGALVLAQVPGDVRDGRVNEGKHSVHWVYLSSQPVWFWCVVSIKVLGGTVMVGAGALGCCLYCAALVAQGHPPADLR